MQEIDNVNEDLQQRGSDIRQAAECVKDRKQNSSMQPQDYEWRWTGQKKKRNEKLHVLYITSVKKLDQFHQC